VAEQGSHEELARQKGIYYHLFRHQLPETVTLGNVA
jgi:ABC-type multidrug transport system fused ATPase/permease subunit